MSSARRAGAALVSLVAVGLALLLVSVQYGLAAEYGAGPGTSLVMFAVLPIGVAVAAAALWGFGRPVLVALVAFSLVVVASTVAAAPLGQREKDRLAAARDAGFACNGPNSELLVPDEVDEGWDDFAHPFQLYGPISQSRYGCTAAIDGPVAETWEPWRRSLLDAGWEVERDGASRVSVTDGVLRAVLQPQDGQAVLTLSTVDAGECEDGGFEVRDDGSVSPC